MFWFMPTIRDVDCLEIAVHGFFQRKVSQTVAFLQEHDQAVDPNLLQLAEAYKIAAGKLHGPTSGDGRDKEAAAAAVAGLDTGEAVEDVELLADLFGSGAPGAETGGWSVDFDTLSLRATAARFTNRMCPARNSCQCGKQILID